MEKPRHPSRLQGILLAVLLLHERPSGVNWAGIGMMVVGAYLVAHK